MEIRGGEFGRHDLIEEIRLGKIAFATSISWHFRRDHDMTWRIVSKDSKLLEVSRNRLEFFHEE